MLSAILFAAVQIIAVLPIDVESGGPAEAHKLAIALVEGLESGKCGHAIDVAARGADYIEEIERCGGRTTCMAAFTRKRLKATTLILGGLELAGDGHRVRIRVVATEDARVLGTIARGLPASRDPIRVAASVTVPAICELLGTKGNEDLEFTLPLELEAPKVPPPAPPKPPAPKVAIVEPVKPPPVAVATVVAPPPAVVVPPTKPEPPKVSLRVPPPAKPVAPYVAPPPAPPTGTGQWIPGVLGVTASLSLVGAIAAGGMASSIRGSDEVSALNVHSMTRADALAANDYAQISNASLVATAFLGLASALLYLESHDLLPELAPPTTP